MRTVEIHGGGPGPFHRGFSAADLRQVLEGPNAPQPEGLFVSGMVDWTPGDVDAVIAHLGSHPTMGGLRHLALPSHGFEPPHVERLAQSERAERIESLDICEVLVDRTDEEVGGVMSQLHHFESLVHLNMYNNVCGVAQVEALAATRLPALTHLSLGDPRVDDEVVLALVDGDAFPSLEWLYLGGVTPELGNALEERGIQTHPNRA